jgi:hypothetical protein
VRLVAFATTAQAAHDIQANCHNVIWSQTVEAKPDQIHRHQPARLLLHRCSAALLTTTGIGHKATWSRRNARLADLLGVVLKGPSPCQALHPRTRAMARHYDQSEVQTAAPPTRNEAPQTYCPSPTCGSWAYMPSYPNISGQYVN